MLIHPTCYKFCFTVHCHGKVDEASAVDSITSPKTITLSTEISCCPWELFLIEILFSFNAKPD